VPASFDVSFGAAALAAAFFRASASPLSWADYHVERMTAGAGAKQNRSDGASFSFTVLPLLSSFVIRAEFFIH